MITGVLADDTPLQPTPRRVFIRRTRVALGFQKYSEKSNTRPAPCAAALTQESKSGARSAILKKSSSRYQSLEDVSGQEEGVEHVDRVPRAEPLREPSPLATLFRHISALQCTGRLSLMRSYCSSVISILQQFTSFLFYYCERALI